MTRKVQPGGEVHDTGDLPLEAKLWRLAEILTAARSIHSSLTLDQVLSSFLRIAACEVGASGGSVYLRDTDGKLTSEHDQLPNEITSAQRDQCIRLANEALDQGESTVLPGEGSLGTIISLPLRDEARANIGVLQVYRDNDSSLGDGDQLFLRELSHFASLSIRNAQYHRDSLVKARMDREMAVAREIQLRALPKTMPASPGYDLAGISRPADETGGDSFDLVASGERDVMILLADATGHGIGAALSVTQVRAMLRLALRFGADLDDAVRHINDQLCDDLQNNRFVTAFIGLVETGTHRVRYHSAGQGPLMHFRAASGTFEWHGASNLPLGFLPITALAAPQVIEFAPGDTLGLITDGVYEAENSEGEMFGQERLAQVVEETRSKACAEAVRMILDKVDEHSGAVPQADDITIVLVRRER